MRHAPILACLILFLGWSRPASDIRRNPAVDSISVSHPEVPEYPRIALAAQLQGTVDVVVEIDSEGEVTASHASGSSPLRDEAEVNARSWRFDHLPAGATFPITHTIRYEFKLEGKRAGVCPRVTFDLPDSVQIVAHPPVPEP